MLERALRDLRDKVEKESTIAWFKCEETNLNTGITFKDITDNYPFDVFMLKHIKEQVEYAENDT